MGSGRCWLADVGHAEDAGAIQTNIVRIDGQKSVYIPILKQGGDSNTIAIVNGVKEAIKDLVDIPPSLKTAVVFDQSVFVKTAVKNLLKEGGIGLVLTALMILLFLGSPRATFAVLLSIPLSALTCFLIMNALGGSINTMLLGGLALAFSRLIDDSVVVLENIFRFMENGSTPREARGKGWYGGGAGGAGSDLDDLHCVFPGNVFLRGEQIPVYGPGVGRGAFDFRFLCVRDDGGAAVLRVFYPH